MLWLIGDSTFDNKVWIKSEYTNNLIPDNYKKVFKKPYKLIKDIAYHLNLLIDNENSLAINCAIEASKIANKSINLAEQDIFVRDNIKGNDTLIISIGGNDVVLSPSNKTRENTLKLLNNGAVEF